MYGKGGGVFEEIAHQTLVGLQEKKIMFHFHSMKKAVKARKVHLELGRVQVSDGLKNAINPSLTSISFSARVKSFERVMMPPGSLIMSMIPCLFSI